MSAEHNSNFFPQDSAIIPTVDQTDKTPYSRIGIIREAISGTTAIQWQDPAREQLETMVAQALATVYSSCGENRWNTVGSYLDQAKLHIIQRGQDEPICVLDPREIANLGVLPNSASIVLRSVLTNSILMLSSNLTSIVELRKLQERKGKLGAPGTQKRSSRRIGTSLGQDTIL